MPLLSGYETTALKSGRCVHCGRPARIRFQIRLSASRTPRLFLTEEQYEYWHLECWRRTHATIL